MQPDFYQDPEGTKYLAKFLASKGFTNVNDMHGQYKDWDIEADWKGITYYFECKMRKHDADRFGDSICEPVKLTKVPVVSHAYLVNFFTDCFTIIPMTAQHKELHQLCQKTELWDRTKKMKTLLSYDNLPKYRHQYE